MFIKEEQDFLTKFSFSTINFYGLPKVHKSKIIQEAIQVQNSEYVKIYEPPDLTLRPIVAGPNCPTRRLSNLVDILLKPFLIHIKSYIKDNLDFLAKCSRENKWDTILTTFDVVGLYSNIPHEYGLEAIEHWLDKFPKSLHPRFTKEFVLESVSFILENKNLNFDNKCFSLKCFILNPRNTSIQFTMEFSKDIIPFLDILIKPSNGNNDGYLSQTNRYS